MAFCFWHCIGSKHNVLDLRDEIIESLCTISLICCMASVYKIGLHRQGSILYSLPSMSSLPVLLGRALTYNWIWFFIYCITWAIIILAFTIYNRYIVQHFPLSFSCMVFAVFHFVGHLPCTGAGLQVIYYKFTGSSMGASLRREDSVLREENCSNFLCGHSHVVWWAKENKMELIFLDLYRISISHNRGWRPRFLLSVGKRNPWSTESSYCTPNPWARLNCHPGLLKKFRFS